MSTSSQQSAPGPGIVDPSGCEPLCGEEVFSQVLGRMVADHAPRLFAIVAEYGDRVDAAIAAWGMAFDDRAELVAIERGLRVTMPTADEALAVFSVGAHIHPRVVWFDPDCASPGEDEPDELTRAEFGR